MLLQFLLHLRSSILLLFLPQFSLWICFLLRASRASLISSRVFLGSMTKASATVAVPSPFCREKHRKAAQRKAQQPMKAVRRWSGIRAKFRN